MHVLGIDAGGTKTVCLLADEHGTVLADARAGGANLQSSGELEVEKVLHQVMEEALGDRDVRPDAICLGIAGVDRPRDYEAIRGVMRRIGFKSRILVVNDALIALTAGAGDDPGVVIIAGTGSIAYGRDAKGRAARSGGWGYLLGDEGGSFWIGRAALAAVVRQFDGRGPATQLTGLVLDAMQLQSPTDLVHALNDRGFQRSAIVAIAPVVHRAEAGGDAVASEILARAASELGAAASAVIHALGMRGDVFSTVLAGGAFRAIPTLAAGVTARLSEIAPRSQVRLLDREPAVGAVHLARAAANGRALIPSYLWNP
jgi:N-acetylglucosamine kinase-like BadF-type ATPase